MSIATSIIPATWDIQYIITKAGVNNHYGYKTEGENTTFKYRTDDYEAVQDVLDNYKVTYADDVLRAQMWEEVKKLRHQYETSPAQTSLGAVDIDDSSKIKLIGLTMMAYLSITDEQQRAIAENREFDPGLVHFYEEFTMANNEVLPMTAFVAIQLGREAGAFVSAVHSHARELRGAIELAANIDDLAEIDIYTGWPGQA